MKSSKGLSGKICPREVLRVIGLSQGAQAQGKVGLPEGTIVGKGAAEIVSHCIVNKQMPSDSSYMICPLPDCDWSIKMPSIIWFGLKSVDIGAAYVNNWQR